MTKSDMHRDMYRMRRISGMSHEEALAQVPDRLKKRFLNDLRKSRIESFTGLKPITFYILTSLIAIIALFMGLFFL